MQHSPVLLADYQSPAYAIKTVDLVFTLAETHTLVASTLQMHRVGADTPLVLHGECMDLEAVVVDGVVLTTDKYQKTDTSLTIAHLPETFSLSIRTRIEPQNNTALSGLYRSKHMFCTQCEPEGFRRITYYLDRPDVMATFRTTIIGDPKLYPVMLSNGNCVSRKDRADGLREVVWEDPYPKPCYLFALVAGNLQCVADTYKTATGREVALEFYVEPAYADRCGAAIQALKDSMRWDEQTYGLSYDLDIYMVVAVSDFNMGAMENKGLNIFNTKYVLADAATATDRDFQAVESVIGHEYFHNWTGNRVTCRDWFQLSLKEGLTVFREQQFSQSMGMGAVKRIQDVNLLRSRQFVEDAGPLAHPVRPASYMEINNFYTATIYNKGAEVIRMQHTLLGAEGFRKGIDLYFQRHDGQAVTTDDFVAAMADANGRNMDTFKRWYTQAGTPEVRVTMTHDSQSQKVDLDFSQSCPITPDNSAPKLPFVIPIVTSFLTKQGKVQAVPALPRGVLTLDQAQQRFSFEGFAERPVMAFLGGFSAPIRLYYPHTEEELGVLIAHAPDPFNRWDAAQQWFTQKILVQAQSGTTYGADTLQFLENFRLVLQDKSMDPAFCALMLTLPSLSYLCDQQPVADLDRLVFARDEMKKSLAKALAPELKARYAVLKDVSGGWVPEAMSARSLKNTCLDMWVQSGDAAALEAASHQYHASKNMTEKMGALWAVNDTDAPVRTTLLDAFYTQGKDDALLVDKWLTLQAISTRKGTLEAVQSLTQHPAFDNKNPNKIYALIGAFASQNIGAFHSQDGKGYAFLAGQIADIDSRNPQVAARLANYFSQWRRFDSKRQDLIRAALSPIVGRESCSPDLAEVLQKTLG